MNNALDALVSLLPWRAQAYAKTIAAVVMAMLTVLPTVTAVPDWVTIVFALLSAPVVFAVPNKPVPGYMSGV